MHTIIVLRYQRSTHSKLIAFLGVRTFIPDGALVVQFQQALHVVLLPSLYHAIIVLSQYTPPIIHADNRDKGQM